MGVLMPQSVCSIIEDPACDCSARLPMIGGASTTGDTRSMQGLPRGAMACTGLVCAEVGVC